MPATNDPAGAGVHANAPLDAENDPTAHGAAAVEPMPLTNEPAGANVHEIAPG